MSTKAQRAGSHCRRSALRSIPRGFARAPSQQITKPSARSCRGTLTPPVATCLIDAHKVHHIQRRFGRQRRACRPLGSERVEPRPNIRRKKLDRRKHPCSFFGPRCSFAVGGELRFLVMSPLSRSSVDNAKRCQRHLEMVRRSDRRLTLERSRLRQRRGRVG